MKIIIADKALGDSLRKSVDALPMCGPLLALLTGILLTGTGNPPVWVLPVIIVALVLWLLSAKVDASRISVTFIWLSAGVLTGYLHMPAELSETELTKSDFTGVVKDVGESNTGVALTVEMLSPVKRVKCMLYADSDALPGDTVAFSGSVEPIITIRDVPEELDPADRLLAKGITCQAFPKRLVVTGKGRSVFRKLHELRERSLDFVYNSSLSKRSKDFLAAMLLSERGGISRDDRALFSIAGISHLLAVSGTHVAIIFAIASLLFMPFLFFGGPKLHKVAVLAVVWLFVALNGFAPSTVRAGIMLSLFVLGRLFMRNISSGNILICAALVMLAFNPYNLYDVGFQLSFCAVAGILAVQPLMVSGSISGHWWTGMAKAGIATLGATAGTAVVSLYHFNYFPVYFLISNILAVLFTPVIIISGVVSLALEGFGLSVYPAVWITDKAVMALEDIAGIISSLPGALAKDIFVYPWVIVPYLLACLFVWCIFHTVYHKRFYSLMTIVSVCLFGTVTVFSSQKVYQPEWFLCRSIKGGGVMVNDGVCLRLFCRDMNKLSEDERARIERRFSYYMARHRLSSFDYYTEYGNVNDDVSRNGLMLMPSQSLYIVPTSLNGIVPLHATYIVVQNEEWKSCAVEADTVISISTPWRRAISEEDARTLRQSNSCRFH